MFLINLTLSLLLLFLLLLYLRFLKPLLKASPIRTSDPCQRKVALLLWMRVNRLIASHMHKVLLNGYTAILCLEVAPAEALTFSRIGVLSQVLSKLTVVDHLGPELALRDGLSAVLAGGLV